MSNSKKTRSLHDNRTYHITTDDIEVNPILSLNSEAASMQSSRNASSLHALGLPDLGLQGRAQLWEMAVAFDLPHARLDEDQRTGHPTLFWVRREPVIHLVGQLTELRIQGFQTVGYLQAHPQHWKTAPGPRCPPQIQPSVTRRFEARGHRCVMYNRFLNSLTYHTKH